MCFDDNSCVFINIFHKSLFLSFKIHQTIQPYTPIALRVKVMDPVGPGRVPRKSQCGCLPGLGDT